MATMFFWCKLSVHELVSIPAPKKGRSSRESSPTGVWNFDAFETTSRLPPLPKKSKKKKTPKKEKKKLTFEKRETTELEMFLEQSKQPSPKKTFLVEDEDSTYSALCWENGTFVSFPSFGASFDNDDDEMRSPSESKRSSSADSATTSTPRSFASYPSYGADSHSSFGDVRRNEDFVEELRRKHRDHVMRSEYYQCLSEENQWEFNPFGLE